MLEDLDITTPEDHVIVLFGATGDLARRKLLLGLLRLDQAGLLSAPVLEERTPVIPYEPGSWGAHGTDELVAPGRWHLAESA